MKMTVVTIALCTALASLCAVPVPVDVTAETLAKIKGNTACAVAYPTSGGCTACIPSGTINVTYSYWMSGTYYTITTTVNVFAKCKAPTPDDMCMTDSTFLSNWKRQLKREPLRQPKREPVGNRKGNHLMQNAPLVG